MHNLGLSTFEAELRLKQFGRNVLVPASPYAALRKWLKTLLDPMVLLLAAAAVIYLLLGQLRDAVALLVAIVPILAVDIILDARTEKALKKIRDLTVKVARVVRDGVERDLPSELLVPGDLLIMKEGDVLPADARLVNAHNLEMDESSLTGEAAPVPKDALSSKAAAVYAGTAVLSGQGKAIITATGVKTRYGQIGHLMSEIKEGPTPLQKKMNRLVLQLLAFACIACLIVWGVEFYRGVGFAKSFLSAVSLAIAAIPEEFPIVFTLYLTMGVFRLSRKKALVRKLVGIETLGSTTVICVDKTGTLTLGKLTFKEHYTVSENQEFWKHATLACEPSPTDQLEKELLNEAAKHNVNLEELFSQWSLVVDYPFDTQEKYMSHIWENQDGERVVCGKGALEGILKLCKDTGNHQQLINENTRLAQMGMRVIAFAFGAVPINSTKRDENEQYLIAAGLVAFSDPPRPGVRQAMQECQNAGIHVVMLTGDHPLTASNIASSVGLSHQPEQIVTGEQLEGLSDKAFSAKALNSQIFARVFPQHKYRLVKALKESGAIVAMTGDGINDALALKEAHIGIAMGVRGTEVAREAATLVLLDDNFLTIVAAVREGRQIFAKMEKAFRYLLTFHIPIIFIAVLAPILGLPLVFTPLVIIWLELIMHPTVALVFEKDKGDPRAMNKPPRDPKKPILSVADIMRSIATGALIGAGILSLYAYQIAHDVAENRARAVAVASLLISEILLVTMELSKTSYKETFRNSFYWITRILSVGVLLLLLYVPLLAQTMQLAPMTFVDWLASLCVASASTLLIESMIWVSRKRAK